MILFIYFCIAVLNIVAVTLTYRFLGNDMEAKSKWVFLAVGIALMYVAVTAVYWLSTKQFNLQEVASSGQNLITFTFVPVNGILTLPFLARTYRYWKDGSLQFDQARNRLILVAVILLVALIFEYFYFNDILEGISSLTNATK